MTTELAPIPRLPIPTERMSAVPLYDRVCFILTDAAVVEMPRDELRTIRSFFDAAWDYAQLVGFSRFTEYRDVYTNSTVFTFWR